MAVVKAGSPQRSPQAAAFNFDDMAQQADLYLAQVRAKAEQIVAEARQTAASVHQQAEREGRAAGERAMQELVERQVARQMETLQPALALAIEELVQSKQAWLRHWEERAVHLATAIAGRVVRREVEKQPQITLQLIREALEFAAGSNQIRLQLNPADHAALGSQVKQLIGQLSRVANAEVVADATISAGGCRVETRHGSIDQQFEAQLARIEAELS